MDAPYIILKQTFQVTAALLISFTEDDLELQKTKPLKEK